MTKTALPFANSPIADDVTWRRLARLWLGTGVIPPEQVAAPAYNTALLPFADASGFNVKVQPGEAYVDGGYFAQDAQQTLPINPPDAANPRIDLLVLRWDGPLGTADYAVLQGTPAAVPVAPSPTQNQGGRWDQPLAEVRVNVGVTNIAASAVTDRRTFAAPRTNPATTTAPGTLSAADKVRLGRLGKGARIWRSTSLAFASAVAQVPSFDTVRHDDGPFYSASTPDRLTVPAGWDGNYTLGTHVAWSGGATGARIVQIRHTRGGTSTTIAEVSMAVATGYKMQSGDYIELVVNQTSGASRSVDAITDKSPVLWLAYGG